MHEVAKLTITAGEEELFSAVLGYVEGGSTADVTWHEDYAPRALLGLLGIAMHAYISALALRGEQSADWQAFQLALYQQLAENDLILTLQASQDEELRS